jgi:hypothetical protein
MRVALRALDEASRTPALSDNRNGRVRSMKGHYEIENINVARDPPTISPTALRHIAYKQIPHIKNQTAFVVGSWSHDRRNTRTEQAKLADPCRENES